MQNQPVAKIGGLVRWELLPERSLDFHWVFSGDKADAVCETDAVGIHDNCRLVKNIAQDQVCRFPADARQLQELIHSIRNLAAVILQQHLGRKNNVPGLRVIKAAGMDNLLKFRDIRCC